jgi:predicted MFS family arabinose efflux permease
MNGIALNSAQLQTSRMLGPAIVGGMLLAGAGLGLVFYINAASFLFVIAALLAIRPRAEFRAGHAAGERGGGEASGAWAALTAGIAYAREHRGIGVLIITIAMLVFFGFPYVIILTAVIQTRLGVSDALVTQYYAIVYTFNGAGALIGALAIAGLRPTIKRERIIPVALAAFSVLIIAFSFAHSLPAMCAVTLLAGTVYMATSSLVMTSIQSSVPGHLRGRVMALFMMAFMGVMPLSAFAFGPLGQAIGPDSAVLVGGVVLLVWALVLLLRPRMLEMDAPAAGA